jgi:hypothetical protein
MHGAEPMTDMNYYTTLIAVADDCPVTRSTVPVAKAGKPTVATLQYAMIAREPHALTQEDVLFESWHARQSPDLTADVAALRQAFFARSQACLRASPLPKQYGFGLLFDRAGRVALCPMESAEYKRLVAGEGEVKVLKAMRTSRA